MVTVPTLPGREAPPRAVLVGIACLATKARPRGRDGAPIVVSGAGRVAVRPRGAPAVAGGVTLTFSARPQSPKGVTVEAEGRDPPRGAGVFDGDDCRCVAPPPYLLAPSQLFGVCQDSLGLCFSGRAGAPKFFPGTPRPVLRFLGPPSRPIGPVAPTASAELPTVADGRTTVAPGLTATGRGLGLVYRLAFGVAGLEAPNNNLTPSTIGHRPARPRVCRTDSRWVGTSTRPAATGTFKPGLVPVASVPKGSRGHLSTTTLVI